ncbi:MAG: HAMP domain-containing sensor histidine kinase [Halieaceae bacterium]|nr:HAMP domain-containing sensor histidine kinase [Halieaceae bacterium]
MNLRAVLTSLTFRFMLRYVLVLSVAVFAVMALLYGIFTYSYFQELQDAVVDELDTVSLIYSGQGLSGVEQYIVDREQDGESRRFEYLLTDESYSKITGTLVRWPEYRELGDGWMAFGLTLTGFDDSESEELLGRPLALPQGGFLLAALRYNEVIESARLVFTTLVRTMVATVLLGVIGGFFAAANTLRRIDSVNEGIDDIVHGDLSQRIPLGDSVGNVRRLIENFNSMLDQTESLMHGVRTVSDNIAHDLRTPLTHIRNNLTRLKQNVPADSGEDVQAIIDECDDILSTFNALLRIAQLEAGNRISTFSRVNLGELVQDVVELYEPLAQEKSVALQCQGGEGVCWDGDRDLIFQMLANLLDNAVKYTETGGRVSVSLSADEDGHPSIEVADSGPGIPETDRENVFQRFFRLESSRGKQPGSGLGLSLVKAVVTLHRGTIQLLDNHPGLRVEVTLG